MIKDSGSRTEYASGAVRDIQEDKGRTDLLPLDIVAELIEDIHESCVICEIAEFMKDGDVTCLYNAIKRFCGIREWTIPQCILEVSKHYSEGALKYGERNWEKGIPVHSYIDSGVRHFLKCIDGWDDEPHDRAFIWNMLGAIWTMEYKPEYNDLPFTEDIDESVEIF